MRISYRTILLLLKVLEETGLSGTIENFTGFLRSYDIEMGFIHVLLGDTGAAVLVRAEYGTETNFIESKLEDFYDTALKSSETHRKIFFNMILHIIKCVLNEIETDSLGIIIYDNNVEKFRKKLLLSLELDGFKYANQRIIPIETEIVETEEVKSAVEEKIRNNPELDFKVLIKHLKDCDNDYMSRSWKNSVSNARHFMEQLLADVAKAGAKHRRECPPKGGKGEPGRVREYLVKSGFFEKNECDSLICGVYSYLSEKGAHRGLTEESCARVSRNIILSLGFYVLEKFETWKRNKYKQLEVRKKLLHNF